MEELNGLTTLITQLGISGVFLGLLIYMWREYRRVVQSNDKQIIDLIDRYEAQITSKDEQLQQVTDRMISAYLQNGQALQVMQGAVQDNTQAVRDLIRYIELTRGCEKDGRDHNRS